MKKIFFLVFGIILLSISVFFAILYLNFFSFGYNMPKYVYFISSRFECLLFFLGILFVFFSLKKKGK